MMYRIKCTRCSWQTKPHYLLTDCIKEKERAHMFGSIKFPDTNAHDAAFGDYCPKCLAATITEHKWID